MTRTSTVAVALAFIGVAAFAPTRIAARQSSAADARLQAALTKDVVEGKCDEAIPIYQQVLTTAGASSATVARALVQLGGCLERSGKPDDARATYERVANEYSDSQHAGEAKRRLAILAGQRSAPGSIGPFKVTPLPALPVGLMSISALSPDGTRLAYLIVTNDGSSAALVLRDLQTREERQLDDSQAAFRQPGAAAKWSPDGRYLAYQIRNKATGAGELRLFIPESSQIRVLKSVPADPTPRGWTFSWAADSDTIIAQPRRNPPARGSAPLAPEVTDVSLTSITTGATRVVGASDSQASFEWSPDHRMVAFRETRSKEKLHQVRMITAATGQALAFPGVGNGLRLMWSPDGRELAARERDEAAGVDQIRIFTLATGQTREVAVPAAIAGAGLSAGWTRQNEFSFYKGSDTATIDYFLMPASGGPARNVCEKRPGGDTCLFLTPDGTTQVLKNPAGRLILRRTSDRTDVPLTIGAGEESAPILSTDGRLLVFASNRDGAWGLYAAPLDRAPVQNPLLIARIDSVGAGAATPGLITARGQLVFQSSGNDDNIYRIDLDPQTGRAIDGRKPVRLTLNFPQAFEPEPSADGKLVAFLYTRGATSGLAVMDADGSHDRVVVEYPTVPEPPRTGMTAARFSSRVSWRSTDEVMFYQSVLPPARSGLRLVNIRTGAVTAVPFELDMYSTSSVVWAYVPARDEILYALPIGPTGLARTLKARNLTSGAERTLVANIVEFVVSADGKVVAYRRDSAERAVELRRITIDGADLGLIKSFPPRPACCPQSPESWSSDNRFFAYSGPNGRHRVLNLETGDDGLLFDHNAEAYVDEWDFPSLRWSPSGTYAVTVGFHSRTETRLWDGVTYEAVTRLMSARR